MPRNVIRATDKQPFLWLKVKPNQDTIRHDQWKATAFLHNYVSKLGARARDKVGESLGLCIPAGMHTQAEVGGCHQIWPTVAYRQEWQAAGSRTASLSSLASTRVPEPPCSELVGGKTWSHSYTQGMQKWSLPWPSRTSSWWERPGSKWKAKWEEEANGKSILSCPFFTKQRSPPLHRGTETDAGPQSHRHLPLTSCAPRVAKAQFVTPLEGAF